MRFKLGYLAFCLIMATCVSSTMAQQEGYPPAIDETVLCTGHTGLTPAPEDPLCFDGTSTPIDTDTIVNYAWALWQEDGTAETLTATSGGTDQATICFDAPSVPGCYKLVLTVEYKYEVDDETVASCVSWDCWDICVQPTCGSCDDAFCEDEWDDEECPTEICYSDDLGVDQTFQVWVDGVLMDGTHGADSQYTPATIESGHCYVIDWDVITATNGFADHYGLHTIEMKVLDSFGYNIFDTPCVSTAIIVENPDAVITIPPA